MKNLYFFFLFLLFINTDLLAQGNLVQNPNFEIYTSCPTGISQTDLATPWFQPTGGTSDYFNTCADPFSAVSVPDNFFGYQPARSGVGYAGLFIAYYAPDSSLVDNREYIEAPLSSPLIAGQKYFVNFYVSRADSFCYATDAIGLYFSNDTIQDYPTHTNLAVIPQIQNPPGNFLTDNTGWTKISGTYIAAGGEKFITIGNFKNDLNTDTVKVSGGSRDDVGYQYGGYYYIDDVCVSSDSLYCATGAVPVNLLYFNVSPAQNKMALNWETAQENNNKGFEILRSEANAAHFTSIGFVPDAGYGSLHKKYLFTDVKAQKGIDYFYKLKQIDFDNKATYSSIRKGRLAAAEGINLAISPNPVTTGIVNFTLTGLSPENFSLIITDVAGKEIRAQTYPNKVTAQFITIDLHHLATGIYMVKFIQNRKIIASKFIKQ